ncbi:DUF3619 family protein [Xenophilus arseniciresistens]|uniref:DUF3619 family protein n=1 Tax=Xenophilus arseniciresistens TaxID=1283306 RepID=A0AAE3N5F3_9BURK|nr:DUF3619 family protein [Xenophilus arseniciresistens]MDA7416220.1 DUF3619 family protein [Xenophilus arseniciresistens]
MNTFSSTTASNRAEDRFGRAVAARLSQGQARLHPDIGERLRVARQQALARRKMEATPLIVQTRGGEATLGQASRWWSWGSSLLPLAVLVVGLISIAQWQAEERADAIAEVDAALLTDELPTAAYTDPGFKQFLQRESAADR